MHLRHLQFRDRAGRVGAIWTGHRDANLRGGFITLSPPQNNGGPMNYGASFPARDVSGDEDRPRRLGRRRTGRAAASREPQDPKQSSSAQRVQLDFVQELNHNALRAGGENQEIEGLISSYELAFRMQGELPKLMDTSPESAATLRCDGIDDRAGGGGAGREASVPRRRTERFGRQCCSRAGSLKPVCGSSKSRSAGVDHPPQPQWMR